MAFFAVEFMWLKYTQILRPLNVKSFVSPAVWVIFKTSCRPATDYYFYYYVHVSDVKDREIAKKAL